MASFEVTKLSTCHRSTFWQKLLFRLLKKIHCAENADKSVFFYHDIGQKSKDSTE